MKDMNPTGVRMLPIQCRMARSALGWSTRVMARRCDLSHDTIARFERGETVLATTVTAMKRALERRGVEFIDGERPGVRIAKGR